MPQQSVRVEGYRELIRACDRAGRETRLQVRRTFRKVGDRVKEAARRKLEPLNARSSRGLRTRVRVREVAVEQSLRKVTGLRPDWGATQMRLGLVPAQREEEFATIRDFEHALDEVADVFNRRP